MGFIKLSRIKPTFDIFEHNRLFEQGKRSDYIHVGKMSQGTLQRKSDALNTLIDEYNKMDPRRNNEITPAGMIHLASISESAMF